MILAARRFDPTPCLSSGGWRMGLWKRTTKPKAEPVPVSDGYLPDFDHIEGGFRKGRSIREGYQRGVGLEFGELRRLVDQDPDFREAIGLAEGRTIVSMDRLRNLFLLIKFYAPALPSGHIVEYGSYNGGSAFFMAALARKFLPNTRVFALDTYAGMPDTDLTVDAHIQGDFVTEPLEVLVALSRKFGLDNIEFVKGYFEDTAAGVMARAQSILLAHIDCDIHEAVKFSYRATKPFMVPCGYFVFDDATTSTCIGAMEAIEESVIQDDRLHAEQVFPHLVFRHPAD